MRANASIDSNSESSAFFLCFQSLFREGRALSFPCDQSGRVHLDDLSRKAQDNYFYARAVVGREFACPVVTKR